jgi:hypothetical protein
MQRVIPAHTFNDNLFNIIDEMESEPTRLNRDLECSQDYVKPLDQSYRKNPYYERAKQEMKSQSMLHELSKLNFKYWF